jgi:hypothetical protein
MSNRLSDSYNGWNIDVDCDRNPGSFCSFDVTDPFGNSHHFPMGGDSIERTLERARELIDLETSMASDA